MDRLNAFEREQQQQLQQQLGARFQAAEGSQRRKRKHKPKSARPYKPPKIRIRKGRLGKRVDEDDDDDDDDDDDIASPCVVKKRTPS